MGFGSKLKKSLKKSFKVLSNPSKMHELKKNLLTPSSKPTLNNLFEKLDPVLDVLDPMHNVVQEYTTGSATTAGQSPYFQKIAPTIVNLFFPGAGSAAAAVSSASEGNGGAALMNAAGAVVGYAGNTGTVLGVSGQTLGRVVSIGATAYGLQNAHGEVHTVFHNPDFQRPQMQPIYESGSYSNPFSIAANYNTPGTNEAANQAIRAATDSANSNRAIVIGAVVLAALWFYKGGA